MPAATAAITPRKKAEVTPAISDYRSERRPGTVVEAGHAGVRRRCTAGVVASVSTVHDKAAVDAKGLTRHVIRPWRHEEPYHVGDVLRALHASQRDPARLPSRELLWRLIEERPLLASDGGPHVRLDKVWAHAVRPDSVAGVSHREALGHA